MTGNDGHGIEWAVTDEAPQTADPLDYEALWRYAIAAVRLLGREVRRLRAELEER